MRSASELPAPALVRLARVLRLPAPGPHVLRSSLLVVPLLAVAMALIGALLWRTPVIASLLGLLVGFAVAVALAGLAERRVGGITDRVLGFTDGNTSIRIDSEGSTQWARLADALNGVGASLQERFDELRQERARVERLLDDLPLAVALFTAEGLVYVNPAATRLFPEAAPGRAAADVLAEGLEQAIEEAAETGRTVDLDLRLGVRDLHARASLTAAQEVALVVSDLTEARRVDAIRRDFVTNASHELKTPVAGMQALADSLVIAVERDPDRAVRMVERLRTEAIRLAQLVRDLLDLARLEEATNQRLRRVDLVEVCRAQVDRLSRLAEERGVAVTADLPKEASVVAVPEDMRLVIGNLIENAVLHNREGGTVRVEVRRRPGEVVVEVADTGPGIGPADRDRVFERFYRIDKGRSRAAGGTGLGLSIVRHALEAHGGRVALTSEVGHGSTFLVTLPVEGISGRG